MKKMLLPLDKLVPSWGALVDLTLQQSTLLKEVNRPGQSEILDGTAMKEISVDVAETVHRVLGLENEGEMPAPELMITNHLETMNRNLGRFYLLWTPLAALLFYFVLSGEHNGPSSWLVSVVIAVLLFLPLLWYRRLKESILEDCVSGKNPNGTSFLRTDPLPRMRARAGLCRAYSGEIYDYLYGEDYPDWVKEGWCRLLQMVVAEEFCRRDGDEGTLYYVLEHITDELNWIATTVSGRVGLRPPAATRRFGSRYSTTSLGSFLTGKPLVDMNTFMVRSFGTAVFLLAREQVGQEKVLEDPAIAVKYLS